MSTFDGVDYDGSIVNKGIKNPNGTIYYIIGIKVSLKNLPQVVDKVSSLFCFYHGIILTIDFL